MDKREYRETYGLADACECQNCGEFFPPDEIRIVERVADVIVVEGSKGAYDDLIRR